MTAGMIVALTVLALAFAGDATLRRTIAAVEKALRENRLRNTTPAEALAKVERWKTAQSMWWPAALVTAIGALIFL